MSTNIDFYFDFMSPFAYLARHRLAACAAEYACEITYKPIDLAKAKLAVGNTGPSNREMPIKLKYLVKDLKRWADLYNLPFGFIGNVNTAKLNKGVFYAHENGRVDDYVSQAYHLTWGESGAPDDVELLRKLALSLDWDPSDFLAYLDSDDAENAYQASIDDAISKGVFGVPTMTIDDEMWWGNDRLFMLEAFLAERFSSSKAIA